MPRGKPKDNNDTKKAKHPGGAPDKYKPEYTEQTYKLCLLGATDTSLANFFNVCEATINNWKNRHPEFLEALRRGKDVADAEVAYSLYHRAKGYSHPEDKIFNDGGEPLVVPTVKHYPPDATSAIFWLKNRNSQQWRDKQELEHSGEIKLPEIIIKRADSD